MGGGYNTQINIWHNQNKKINESFLGVCHIFSKILNNNKRKIWLKKSFFP